MNSKTKDVWIEQLHSQIIDEVIQQMLHISHDVHHRAAQGKWSVIEILGHLCDSARFNLQRFHYLNHHPVLQVISYPQDTLVTGQNYQQGNWENLLRTWQSLNEEIVRELRNSVQWKSGQVILADGAKHDGAWLLQDYVLHMEHHLRQINERKIVPEWHVPLQAALSSTHESIDARFKILFENPEVVVEMYKPIEKDLQNPHSRDEIYIIAEGCAEFVQQKETTFVSKGDFLFVPARNEHHFLNFSKDFATWVIFYGPEK